ncbi:MAG: hypothetical protein J6A85_08695 [Clostridia bacterium]|nr:hypothetical protein [Clostridia bacterium]
MLIKQILKSENGEDAVYINLSLPDFGNGILKKKAEPFYRELAEKYILFAKKRLLPLAVKTQVKENFKPFSAVMKYVTEEDEKQMTVKIRTFVFDGAIRREGRTAIQRWDKKTGILLGKK